MIELPIVFVAGILGSSHCVGMCGPFALAIGSAGGSWSANLRRQLLFTSGRIFTYAFLGSLAGFAGQRLKDQLPALLNASAVLAIVAGVFLVYQGLLAARVIPSRVKGGGPCLTGGILATWLRSPHWPDAFLAGLFTGLIPCGLLYGFLALAAATSDILHAALMMVVFGLGTAPVLLLVGSGGRLLDLAFRRHIFRIAAWCVVVTGLISVARGVGAFVIPGSLAAGSCPLCL